MIEVFRITTYPPDLELVSDPRILATHRGLGHGTNYVTP